MSGGDDHAPPDQLFAGDETARCSCEDDTVAEEDAVDLRRWAASVTYKELHSFVLGFAPAFLLFSLSPTFPALTEPLVAVVAAVTLGGFWCQRVPEGRVRRWLCKEPHYAWGGQLLASLLCLPLLWGWV